MSSTYSLDKTSTWNLSLLFFWNAVAFLLLFSLFHHTTAELWKGLDSAFFRWINAPLASHPRLRLFWALSNHKIADWVEDVCFLALYIFAIIKSNKGERKKKAAQFLFCILWTAFTILLMNRLVCRDLLCLRRHSPTLLIDGAYCLTDFISWLAVKVDSTKSFPGDHATTALMITLSFSYFVRGRLRIIALIYGIFLCLPRLATGAHWLSDLLVGSVSIVILSLSWALCSPIYPWALKKIEKGFDFFSPHA